MKKNSLEWLIKAVTILMTLLIVGFVLYGLKQGIFSSDKSLFLYIKQFGIIGPFVFLIIQMIQVVFPVIPGGASCLAGVLAFGGFWGFIYNYIGLTIGSIFAFFLSRKFGLSLIEKFFKEETIQKYLKYIRTKKFDKVFFLGILFPGAPDDLLCYIAGISKMKFQTFLIYVLLGKPLTLIFYSLFADYFYLIFR